MIESIEQSVKTILRTISEEEKKRNHTLDLKTKHILKSLEYVKAIFKNLKLS